MTAGQNLGTGRVAKVSVIVPCYRYGQHLPGAVASVLSQQGVDADVLIIDDASPDGSGEVAASLARSDSRVASRHHKRNLGHIATYNEGLDWADGDYTVLLSADDLLAPGALRRATDFLDAHPDVGFVYGPVVRFQDGAPLPPERSVTCRSRVLSGSQWVRRRCSTGANVIACPEVMVRTTLQKKVGGYRPELPHSGDLEMWMRLAAHAPVGILRGPVQAYLRTHPTSMSATRFSSGIEPFPQFALAFELFFRTDGALLPDSGACDLAARKALARQALWRACRAFDRGRVDAEPVDELVAFACELYPGATTLSEFRGLRVRRAIGPAVRYARPLVLTPALRRIRLRLRS